MNDLGKERLEELARKKSEELKKAEEWERKILDWGVEEWEAALIAACEDINKQLCKKDRLDMKEVLKALRWSVMLESIGTLLELVEDNRRKGLLNRRAWKTFADDTKNMIGAAIILTKEMEQEGKEKKDGSIK